MASRKKNEAAQFTGALAEPIIIAFEPQPVGVENWKPKGDFGFVEQMKKMSLLAEHYNVANNDHLELAFKLALDFVPGFQVVYDDPLAAAMGLPVRAKAVRSGKGAAPEFWGPRLLTIVEWLKGVANGRLGTDRLCAEFLFDTAWPMPGGRLSVKERKAGVATIERRIREARRRRDGPAKIVRGRSKLN